MSYNRNTVRRARSDEDDDDTSFDSSDYAGSDDMEEGGYEGSAEEQLLRIQAIPVRIARGAPAASAAAAAATDDDEDLRMIDQLPRRRLPMHGIGVGNAPNSSLSLVAADDAGDAPRVKRATAQDLNVITKFFDQPHWSPYTERHTHIAQMPWYQPPWATWPHAQSVRNNARAYPERANLWDYVAASWDKQRMPRLDPDDEVGLQPWQEVAHMVYLGQNAVDWGRNLSILSGTYQAFYDEGELEELGKETTYDTDNLFDVPAYVDRYRQADVRRRMLMSNIRRAVDDSTPVRTNRVAQAVHTWGVVPTLTASAEGVAYARNPFMVADQPLDMRRANARGFRYNRSVHISTFNSIYGSVEYERQLYVVSINKMMLSCLMEQAILYGPIMSLDRDIMPHDYRDFSRECMKLWYGGTVGLEHESRYTTGSPDQHTHLLQFRRVSCSIIRENWQRERWLWLFAGYKEEHSDLYSKVRHQIPDGAPVLQLSKNAFNLYMLLLPVRWQSEFHEYLRIVRQSITADHYHPIRMTGFDDDDEILYAYMAQDTRVEVAQAASDSALKYASMACVAISMQVAATAYGTYPGLTEAEAARREAAAEEDEEPLDYYTFFTRLLGPDALAANLATPRPEARGAYVEERVVVAPRPTSDSGGPMYFEKVRSYLPERNVSAEDEFVASLKEIIAMLQRYRRKHKNYAESMYWCLFPMSRQRQYTHAEISAMLVNRPRDE